MDDTSHDRPRHRAAIVAVERDPIGGVAVADELRRRYASDYRVECASDPDDAARTLDRLRAEGVPVALVLAVGSDEGVDLLAQAKARHGLSKRALLVPFGAWGDPASAALIRRAVATGRADCYLLAPSGTGDELFHRTITELLHEFARANPSAERREFAVVAPRWSARGHEVRQMLLRNGVPHVGYDADSAEGRALLESAGEVGADVPVVVPMRGQALVDPDNAELARRYGVTTDEPDVLDHDVVVVGAGPGGLAAAISSAAEGLSVLAIECESIGGQASSSSRIRNYPGFSRGVSGAELAQRAYQQAWIFGVDFLHTREVTALRLGGERHTVVVGGDVELTAAAVVLATGVAYRTLGLPSIEGLLGRGVYYGASVTDCVAASGDEVVVVGGGNSAGQAALHLALTGARVSLVSRQATLATSMSQYLRDALDATPNIAVRPACEVVDGGGDGHLQWLTLRTGGVDDRIDATSVYLFLGGTPRTGWLPADVARDDGGYILTGTQASAARPDRDGAPEPSTYETSVPGVFAVGDVRAGSVKRVASAVGEGSVVVPDVYEHVCRVSQVGVAR